MSYEKVRSIKVDEKLDKVFVTSACNNVRPLEYNRWEITRLSEILKAKGKLAVDIEILKLYESGVFQDGNNKYNKANTVLRLIFKEEYAKFDWSLSSLSDEYKLRDTEEFNILLGKALDYKLPKDKFVISKPNPYHSNKDIYAKRTINTIRWRNTTDRATKYFLRELAEQDIKNFTGSEEWKVVEVTI